MDLDVGSGFAICHKRCVNCLRVDIQQGPLVDRVCSIYDLTETFGLNSFEKVYCNHVLEHLTDPIEGLKQLIGVAQKYVFVEVPHWLSSNAKQDSINPFDRHLCSFKTSWFHKVLAKMPHHLEVHYRFPCYLYIQCEVYL